MGIILSTAEDSDTDDSNTKSLIQKLYPNHTVYNLPTKWNIDDSSNNLEISNDGLELTKSLGNPNNSAYMTAVSSIRANRGIPWNNCKIYYFEVKILDQGEYGYISIGFMVSSSELYSHIGWRENSYGYHANGDGYNASEQSLNYGPSFSSYDTIGCGYDFSKNEIFYTKNGKIICLKFENVTMDEILYPAIGLTSVGEKISVNFGKQNFKFDILKYSNMREDCLK